MKKRGFLCICLTTILLVALLPSAVIANASNDDRYFLFDTFGLNFYVQSSGLVSNDITSPEAGIYWGSITIRTGTSLLVDVSGFYMGDVNEFQANVHVTPYGTHNRMTWNILPQDMASITFNTPGRYDLLANLIASMGGFIDIYVVEAAVQQVQAAYDDEDYDDEDYDEYEYTYEEQEEVYQAIQPVVAEDYVVEETPVVEAVPIMEVLPVVEEVVEAPAEPAPEARENPRTSDCRNFTGLAMGAGGLAISLTAALYMGLKQKRK